MQLYVDKLVSVDLHGGREWEEGVNINEPCISVMALPSSIMQRQCEVKKGP